MSIKQGGNTIAGAVGKYPLNERNITNCITEIPQDINLELNNGTLTLKAGSKVYVPNGAGVFDELTIANDLSGTPSVNTATALLFVSADGTSLQWRAVGSCGSGTTDAGTTGTTFYNTSSNQIISHNSGGNVQVSFPLCEFNSTSNTVMAINQVFNGFGYMGSTVFALPGVKGLIPDGRNADGTLKNINFTVENITTNSLAATGWHGMWSFYFNGVDSAAMIHPTELEYISDSKPTGIYTTTAFWYSPSENKLYYTQDIGSTWTQIAYVRIDFTETSQKITSIDTEYPFRAVGYRDTEYMAHQAMPSNRYIDLTLGANGSTYTAPADGWFCLSAIATNNTSYVNLNVGVIYQSSSGENTDPESVLIPAKKGAVATIYYVNINLVAFRFVYANGVA